METDWVIPDLRITRLSDANPIPLDQQNRGKIVPVRCHSLKPYFKLSCFQINVQTGQMYTHTHTHTTSNGCRHKLPNGGV